MGLFIDNLYIIGLGVSVFLLSVLFEMGCMMNIVIINLFCVVGDVKYFVLIGVFFMVLMSLLLGYFFVFYLDMGFVGIWLVIVIDEWICVIIMFFCWKSRVWECYVFVKFEE